MSSGQDQARVTLEAWLVTDVGMVRDHNEDSAFMEATKGFFIVADGMGGHAAGEVASAMAVETIHRTLVGQTDPDETRLVRDVEAIDEADVLRERKIGRAHV